MAVPMLDLKAQYQTVKDDVMARMMEVIERAQFIMGPEVAEFERRYLASILSAAAGNVTKAASLVGKERRAFGRLLKKHDIDKSAYSR